MEILIIPLLTAALVYWLITMPRSSNRNTYNYKKNLPVLSVQSTLKARFGTNDVYGYRAEVWIVRQRTSQVTKHYLVSSDGTILAETSQDGFIYAAYKCHRLFITTDAWGNNVIKYYGAVDDQFNPTIPMVYEKLEPLEEDFVQAYKDKHAGVYDPQNKLIIPVEYETVLQDVGNKMFILTQKGTYQLFDYGDNYIKTLGFSSLFIKKTLDKTFVKTFTLDSKNELNGNDEQLQRGNWGLLNQDYKELIHPQYQLLYNGSNHVLVMKGHLDIERETKPWPGMESMYFATGGQWGVVDLTNRIIIPIAYDWIDLTASDIFFLVNAGGKMHYIKPYNETGYWRIWGGKWGLINNKNQVVTPLEYDHILNLDNSILFQKSDKQFFNLEEDYLTFPL